MDTTRSDMNGVEPPIILDFFAYVDSSVLISFLPFMVSFVHVLLLFYPTINFRKNEQAPSPTQIVRREYALLC